MHSIAQQKVMCFSSTAQSGICKKTEERGGASRLPRTPKFRDANNNSGVFLNGTQINSDTSFRQLKGLSMGGDA